ncbi:Uncharacterised protein [Salmonella enterica subsp. enterica]|uniref:Uncharacterized protein n=1 Tax=Salmonella enterica I TaxID=59201 RepID=A0A3S4IN11_SALET|nr:Uncharacterised protein [Salmonella enterica subsp. enterica]
MRLAGATTLPYFMPVVKIEQLREEKPRYQRRFFEFNQNIVVVIL